MPVARFETKGGDESGAGYERWRSWVRRPSSDVLGSDVEDLFRAQSAACTELEGDTLLSIGSDRNNVQRAVVETIGVGSGLAVKK